LKSQLEYIEELKKEISGINDYRILLLPTVTCDNNFYECLESFSTSVALDGLLFYHKEAFYTSGVTPLVTWLKTYMLPEVFGMNVPESLDEKPSSYIDFEHHVLNVLKNKQEKNNNLQKTKNKYVNIFNFTYFSLFHLFVFTIFKKH
jgi:snurportin-1